MATHKDKQEGPQSTSNASNNTSEQQSETPSPADVAEEFGREYYSTLSANSTELHKYYKEDSVFTTTTEGSLEERIVGPMSIQGKLQAAGLKNYRVRLPVFVAQESINGGIVILAKGTFVKKGEVRHFVQTFLLAPQHPSGWYIKNDVLAFFTEQAGTPSAASAATLSTASTPSSSTSSTPSNAAPSTTASQSSQQHQQTANTPSTNAPATASAATGAPSSSAAKDQTSSGAAGGASAAPSTTSSSGAAATPSSAGAAAPASTGAGGAATTSTSGQAAAGGAGSQRESRPFGRPQQQQNGRSNEASQFAANTGSSPSAGGGQQGGRRPGPFGRNKGKEKDESELAPGEKPKNTWASIVSSSSSGTATASSGGVATGASPNSFTQSPSTRSADRGPSSPKSPSTTPGEVLTVRVRNLPFEATESQVRDMFKQYGDITKVKMNRGYCFIEFSSNSAVKDSVAAADLRLDGRPLQVEEKPPKQQRRGVRADGKRVGMGEQSRPRQGGRGGGRGGDRDGRQGGGKGGSGKKDY